MLPYVLTTFDGLTLPTAMGSGQLSVKAQAATDIWTLAGGRAWDALRTDRARAALYRYQMDCMITGANAAAVLTAYQNLRAKDGVSGTLTRTDSGGATNTITARMTWPSWNGSPHDGSLMTKVSLIFEGTTPPWQGTARTGSVVVTGAEGSQTITNSGNAPWLPTLTLTAGSGSVTAFGFLAGPDATGRHWHWAWAGTLAAGKSLVVNCRTKQITNDGTANYGLTLDASHNQNEWVEVPNGGLTFAVTVSHSGTDPTLSWTSYDGWL